MLVAWLVQLRPCPRQGKKRYKADRLRDDALLTYHHGKRCDWTVTVEQRTIFTPRGRLLPSMCFFRSSRTISGLILPGADHKWKSGVRVALLPAAGFQA